MHSRSLPCARPRPRRLRRLPAPMQWTVWTVFVCGARVSVCVCVRAALCAPHVVSPRDLWRCVLPRWHTLQKMYTLQSAAHGAPWLLAQMP
jgi:hypothetical protein